MTQRQACDPHMDVDTARLAGLRAAKGWLQRDLAASAGLSMFTVNRVENGKDCTLGSLLKIAEALGVPHTDLLLEPATPTSGLPPLRPRLEQLLDEYDAAPRGSDDHLLAALVRATVSARGAIGRAQERDEARAVLAEQQAVAS